MSTQPKRIHNFHADARALGGRIARPIPHLTATLSLVGASTRGRGLAVSRSRKDAGPVVFVDIPFMIPMRNRISRDCSMRSGPSVVISGPHVLVVRALRTNGQTVEGAQYPFDITAR